MQKKPLTYRMPSSKYKPMYSKMLIEFFSTEPFYEKEENAKNPKSGKFELRVVKKANKLPMHYQFAHSIGVAQSTLRSWAEHFPEFKYAYDLSKEMQKNFISQNVLNGIFNPIWSIFLAKNITDMRDVKETDITSNGKPLSIKLDI